MNSGLPPIDPTFEPASVRNGSPATQKAYAAALNFESMLVQQLSQSLTQTSGLGGGEDSESEGSSSDPVSSQLSSLLPQTFTDSIMSHGGLGMAQQLIGDIDPAASSVPDPASTSKLSPSGGVKA
jgi:Rod binding domain-containing protein